MAVDMIKVINERLPMTDNQSEFTAFYIPTFYVEIHNHFLNQVQ